MTVMVAQEVEAPAQVATDVERLQPTSGALPGPTRFVQVVKHGRYVFISGQTAAEHTGRAGKSYEMQCQQVLHELDELLQEAGTSKHNLLQVRVYLKDCKSGSQAFDAAWQAWAVPEHLPTRTTVQCTMIDPTLLVEIDAIAVLPESAASGALCAGVAPLAPALSWGVLAMGGLLAVTGIAMLAKAKKV